MTIRQISLNGFRNLQSTTLDLDKNLNLITGLNASGKTSFLEALHIICQGRSFKTHNINQCIQHKKNSFLIFSKFENYKAGISRTKNKTSIRVENKTVNKVSSLAKKTPVRIINNSCFDLILGSPGHRREYIDWCLFHVEPSYLPLSLNYKHALKQRNALLKSKKNLSELNYWDEYISSLGMNIYQLRLDYVKSLNDIFKKQFHEFQNETKIDLVYKPGWNIEASLIEVLRTQRQKDIRYGYTRYGTHRDDINILSDGSDIKSIFSRGQIKKLSILLFLAQIHLLSKNTNKSIILLIDDIDSELDQLSVEYVLEKISNLQLQIFITNIKQSSYLLNHHEEYGLFHVEHGMIKAVKNTREHNV